MGDPNVETDERIYENNQKFFYRKEKGVQTTKNQRVGISTFLLIQPDKFIDLTLRDNVQIK